MKYKLGSFSPHQEYPSIPKSYAVLCENDGRMILSCPCKDTINQIVVDYENYYVCKVYLHVEEESNDYDFEY